MAVPLDTVKTTLQQKPTSYAGPIDCAKDLVAKDGPGGLFRGADSTLVGHGLAGAISFGMVEVFDRALRSAAGPGVALLFGPSLLIGAAVGSTAICATAVCPFEVVRMKSVESGKPGLQVLREILRKGKNKIGASFYRGFNLILLKDIPFVVTKFLVFNALIDYFSALVRDAGTSASPLLETQLTLLAGVLAGTVAAVINQPADVLFTLVNQGQGFESVMTEFQKTPVLVAKGLRERLLFNALLVTLEFFFYLAIRDALGVSEDDLTLVWDALAPLLEL
eukprot:gnl/TRDRNA2_/TRDRNA2_25124_c0_seq1.p1 gnl/TRDRNA2_/TRDRNA2_25124_c0~~gnl/TRDRNA2_/TRDRNA2_25124_c0_seq1.p1  ORF type:complete len:305 (+),score=42.28 gnl/TRDRNA2_/TRDRNA2_25124_c0_seq1:81-917(+)